MIELFLKGGEHELGMVWYMTVIPATREIEIMRIVVRCQWGRGGRVNKTPSQQNKLGMVVCT
jgi:hypothetical protein